MSSKKNSKANKEELNLLQKFALFFYDHIRVTAVIFALILIGGFYTYTSVIKREGFPPIQFPISIVQGTYFVDDVNKIDSEIVTPLNKIIGELEDVKEINSAAGANFFTFGVFMNDGVLPEEGSRLVMETIESSGLVPESARISYTTINPGAYLNEYDMLLSVYSTKEVEIAELEKVAAFVSDEFVANASVARADVKKLTASGVNSTTGQPETRQTSYNHVGFRTEANQQQLEFYQAVTIGVNSVDTVDVFGLADVAEEIITSLDLTQFGDNYVATVGIDSAADIDGQISALQSNLLTGLLAVAVVSLLLITWRASIITAIFMLSVMLLTIVVLWLVGYSLNTITLFALVLSLGLFVDDATIVVEAIDANRLKAKRSRDAVVKAIKRVASASFAGTMTTVLVFMPLAFVTGILGEFIRLMPITVIVALLTSLVLSLTLIPFLARFLLLRNKHISWITKNNPVSRLEKFIADKLAALPMLLNSRKKLGVGIGVFMVLMSFAFVYGAGQYAGKLNFNIFPPAKDSDQIGLTIDYAPGTTLPQAEAIATTIDDLIKIHVGDNAKFVLYGTVGQPNNRTADVLVQLVPFGDRETKSPEMIDSLQTAADVQISKSIASVKVLQFDAGPPVSDFPFQAQIYDEDPSRSVALAKLVAAELEGATVTRPNGTTAQVTTVKLKEDKNIITRSENKRFTEVVAGFDADDVSALLIAMQSQLEEVFTPEYLAELGYDSDVLAYDFGQESENADSFKSLTFVFPIALLLMFALLAIQFRSLLQPLLIFLAIPFSFFGVTAGLYAFGNPISFFVLVGFIGLVGIAVNNTIMLTDYANQEQRNGLPLVEAVSSAIRQRFRPLLTTSLTTMVALLPLALSDPFWEALAFTIIFGLLSSTFLVITAFPYYYLGAEQLRKRYTRRNFLMWTTGLIALAVAVARVSSSLVMPVLFVYFVVTVFGAAIKRRVA